MRVTWEELDRVSEEAEKPDRHALALPNVPDGVYRQVLCGEGDPAMLRSLFPDGMQDFISDCYTGRERISRVTEADVQNFITGKPEWSEAEIKEKLPNWLRDLCEAFLPRKAN